ncbi:MAG: hypothetical protein ABSA57_02970 [Candidatus Acidiferrales bacterium]
MPRFFRPPLVASLLLLAAVLINRPTYAQVDLSGYWDGQFSEDEPERIPGPEIGDYTSMPLNDAARMRADAWDAQKLEMVEHECDPHPMDYGPRGGGDIRLWSVVDPFTQGVIAWRMTTRYRLAERTIYMDGRLHPSENAPHTWQGFSTGEWEGDMLKVITTHLKEGQSRRNGVPRSDRSTVIEYFIRHGEFFTLVTDVEDPVYLTEPLIRTSDFVLDLGRHLRTTSCIPNVDIPHPEGYVAYHVLGENHWLSEVASRWGIPVEAVRGGAETTYPEYQERLAKLPPPPDLPEQRKAKK